MARTAKNNKSKAKAAKFRKNLLAWYDKNARTMPWRPVNGMPHDPYRTWLSEVMLQQTTVTAVTPYFLKFLKLWPRVQDLANAPQEQVMKEWAGLGYYARARNLHACAKIVANDLAGKFPDNQDELRKLPGIGDYTSASITAIAFNKPATVVDGNVERVMARYWAVTEPLPGSKTTLKALAHDLYDGYSERPGDLAQAFMELGATICIPKNPRCGLCPVSLNCEARKQGIQTTLPRKAKKTPKTQKSGYVYWISNKKGQILVHHRPEKGLLGGMIALPTSEWSDSVARINHVKFDFIKPQAFTPLGKASETIRHVFTHFDLELKPYVGKIKAAIVPPQGYSWMDIVEIKDAGFPSLFQKAGNMFINKLKQQE
jgi:A/G-specific adenine glycosylase